MKTKYPFLEVKKYGDYPSAIIHLAEDISTIALPSQRTLLQKMRELVRERKLTQYHVFEFLKKAVAENMIEKIFDEDEEDLPPFLKKFMQKMFIEELTENPYSERPCIKKLEISAWQFSTPNHHSEIFFNKQEGLKELEKMFKEKDSRPDELEEVTKLLYTSKEIPGQMLRQKYDTN